ncbi:MAG TPA: DNA polymerase IV [Anaeromyxobacteraceae bacterium]|nr:DNA polymerase IV [Anaeromyxobacteraceae bacterium]
MGRPRAILHLDLDAFYASVEQLDHPELRGRPVIVCGTSNRGVVCAASYQARRFGVRSAMPTWRARRLCPEGIILPPRFSRYEELSLRVFDIYRRTTPLVEPLSLDEAFLDVTDSLGSGLLVASALKRAVRDETGLTVSAGLADAKLAAKIASDLSKPDGLLEVPPGTTREFLAPLPVSRLWGVGRVTERALAQLGVHLIGQLAEAPPAFLASALGIRQAHALLALARGEDAREVVASDQAKSVGAEETFEQDLVGPHALVPHLLAQAERVGRRLRELGEAGRVVTLKVKYADFTLVTRRCTLAAATDDGRVLYEAARSQLERLDLLRPVRLTGLSVSGFDLAPQRQLSLFERPGAELRARRSALCAALDAITERFGEGAIGPASLVERGQRRGR